MSSNFEVKHTIRLYDTDLIAEIGRTYDAHYKEYRNKNEFLTELLRIGIRSMNSTPPKNPAGSQAPPAAFTGLTEAVAKVKEIGEETAEYIKLQFQRLNMQMEIAEKMLSAIYAMQLGELSGEPPLPQKVEDGFFDDLPMRFEKIILSLETKYGLK